MLFNMSFKEVLAVLKPSIFVDKIQKFSTNADYILNDFA